MSAQLDAILENRTLLLTIDELHLSVRTANALKNAGCKYFFDIIKKTESEILLIPHLGRKPLNEIKEVLAGYGYHLGMTVGVSSDTPGVVSRVELARKAFADSDIKTENNIPKNITDEFIVAQRLLTEAGLNATQVRNLAHKPDLMARLVDITDSLAALAPDIDSLEKGLGGQLNTSSLLKNPALIRIGIKLLKGGLQDGP